MQKLQVKSISCYSILLFSAIILLSNCKGRSNLQENGDEKLNLPTAIPLTKEEFFKCSEARDTVFTNGDYLKFIPVGSDHYEIEINMNGAIDTLDYYLTCQTPSGTMPKLLFKLNSDYIGLGQGSSSYRYLTLCSFNNKGNLKKIEISKFETARDVSSVNDGFIFKIMDTIYFYDLRKSVLLFKKLSNKLAKSNIKESTLYDNSFIVDFENGDSLNYKLKDFQLL